MLTSVYHTELMSGLFFAIFPRRYALHQNVQNCCLTSSVMGAGWMPFSCAGALPLIVLRPGTRAGSPLAQLAQDPNREKIGKLLPCWHSWHSWHGWHSWHSWHRILIGRRGAELLFESSAMGFLAPMWVNVTGNRFSLPR